MGSVDNALLHYDPTTWYVTTAELKGLILGQTFRDKRGYLWQLHKLNTALAAAASVAGTVMLYKDPEAWTVTDDRSDAFTINSVPIFAGLCCGIFDPSGSTSTTDRIIALLISGIYNTVMTDGGDDIVEGDLLVVHATHDGGVDRQVLGAASVTDPTDAPATADDLREDLVDNVIPSIESLFTALAFRTVGTAIDDDVNADDTVKAYISKRAFC